MGGRLALSRTACSAITRQPSWVSWLSYPSTPSMHASKNTGSFPSVTLNPSPIFSMSIRYFCHLLRETPKRIIRATCHYAPGRAIFVPVALATDLDAFYLEHSLCGDLDTGLTTTEPERVWVTC